MQKLITEDAQMKCSLGASPAKLSVTSQAFTKISGGLVATEQDKQSLVNIPSFGSCKRSSPPPVCMPSPQKWQKTTIRDNIDSMMKLTKDSICPCSNGGIITFVDTGKNIFIDGE